MKYIFFRSIKDAFRKIFCYKGRATRPQYWYFILFSLVIEGILHLAVKLLQVQINDKSHFLHIVTVYNVVVYLYYTVMVIRYLVQLSLGFRRMHDSGKPGFIYIIISLIATAMNWNVFFIRFYGKYWSFEKQGITALVFLSVMMISGIAQIVLCSLPSDKGPNKYGDAVLIQEEKK